MTTHHPSFPTTPIVIEGYDEKGYAIASVTRVDGFTATVRFFGGIDGESVQLQSVVPSKYGKGCRDATSFQIIQESPFRVASRCAHFGTCGGCVLQHIEPSYQTKIKEKKIQALFESECGSFLTTTRIDPIIGNGQIAPWAYRNKMEFSFAQDRAGKRFLGLYDRLGRGVTPIHECHLVNSWMQETVQKVFQWWEDEASHLTAFSMRSGEGTLRSLTLREGISSSDRMVILTVSSKPEYAPKAQDVKSFKEMIEKYSSPQAAFQEEGFHGAPHLSVVLRIHQSIPKMPTQIYEMILSGPDYIRETIRADVTQEKSVEYTFHISPQAFFQPNSHAARHIYSQALQFAELTEEDVVYDLYCGTGTFGMFAAAIAKKVIAIEISKDAAYDAKTNAERLGITNFSIHCGDVTEVLHTLRQEENKSLGQAPVVIIDPPRVGLHPGAIEEICSLKPKRIVYVSCNPLSQVKDLNQILSRGGWKLKAMRPVDQFAHTPHVENIALLEREFVDC